MTTSDALVQSAAQGGRCLPIALCNALTFWHLPHPKPGTPAWELMIDVAACRHGATIHAGAVADYLGLVLIRSTVQDVTEGPLPLVITVHDPKFGIHSVLLIERKGSSMHLVNYEGRPSTWIEYNDIEFVPEEKLATGFAIAWAVARYQESCSWAK